MQTETRWYHLIAYFFGGAFLANTIPHLVNGISGSPFQSPFASPPGEGLSSAMVNVLWGTFNLVVAYVLVVRVGRFELRQTRHAVALGLGVLLMALMLARAFARFHGGASDQLKCGVRLRNCGSKSRNEDKAMAASHNDRRR